MSELKMMWEAYYKLNDYDAKIVTEAGSRIASLTNLEFTEGLYVIWKMGIYLAEKGFGIVE